jgi:hypothetical protein
MNEKDLITGADDSINDLSAGGKGPKKKKKRKPGSSGGGGKTTTTTYSGSFTFTKTTTTNYSEDEEEDEFEDELTAPQYIEDFAEKLTLTDGLGDDTLIRASKTDTFVVTEADGSLDKITDLVIDPNIINSFSAVTATNITTVEAISFLTDQGIAGKLTDSTFATNSNVVFSTFT